ncbi:flavocytochrome c [Sporolactobacillus sp. THM19-2]|uniref:flavocytochrome c n=1 Tax=Sporolactobacillus sp. THM19-2 TaxID=2511171 RepID=UPI00101EFADE|nr:flavocytochrome c [Sporolactobacillus sp. THM19-2]RYL94671.1 flavocytochrome c [Sporolactobacillus sp. THM19-2]
MTFRCHKTVCLILMLFLVAGTILSGCSSNASSDTGKFDPGTYEGVSKGHGGDVKAKVTVTKDKIKSITVDAKGETGQIGSGAARQLTDEIIATQSLAVDAVSGASESSAAILEAVTRALEKAGGDIEALKDPKNKITVKEQKQKDLNVDVAVIGSGGAGLSAAIEADAAGKSVVILEKMPIIGGNTNRATGGMNAAETSIQKKAGIKDSRETFFNDTMKGGKNLNDPKLVRTLVDHAPGTVEWVNQLGAGLTDVTLGGGATNKRLHRPADGSPVGPVLVNVLTKKIKAEGIHILLNTRAEKLMVKNGTVAGVEAKDAKGNLFQVHAPAVIMATGGFSANSDMVEKYRPDLKGYFTTNHKGATGEGIRMAVDAGAAVTQMDQIQTHPTTDPETGFMFTEAVRGDGGLLINREGKRFVDEMETRDVVSDAIIAQKDHQAFLVTNDAIKEKNASLAQYIKDGYAVEGSNVEELARAMKVDPGTLEKTMADYASYVQKGKDKEFGRAHLEEPLAEGKYYAIPVVPSVHHTMGGLKIDTKAHVLHSSGRPVKGLYAAGEVTGGVHGGNRLGGNAVADIITFGRIAGQTAAAEIN